MSGLASRDSLLIRLHVRGPPCKREQLRERHTSARPDVLAKTYETDNNLRMAWTMGDLVENRTPLHRVATRLTYLLTYNKDKEAFAAYLLPRGGQEEIIIVPRHDQEGR